MTVGALIVGLFLAVWGFAAPYRRRKPYDLLGSLLGTAGMALALGSAVALLVRQFP